MSGTIIGGGFGLTADLLAALLAFFIAAASPGPATLAVAATSMARGRSAGLLLGLGLSVGIGFWGALTAVGLGALILTWAPALIVLKIVGGAYLLYLAWLSARSAIAPGSAVLGGAVQAPGGMLWRGLVLNLLNPKAVLAWTAAIALGLPAEGAEIYLLVIVLACTLMSVGIYAGYAALFSLEWVRAAYLGTQRWCDGVFAVCFAGAGLRLIFWKAGPA